MQVVFGSRVMPVTGPAEAKRERLTIYQEIIPELLDMPVGEEDICCRIFGPKEALGRIKDKLGWKDDEDYNGHCLIFQGDTARVLELLGSVFPDLETLNSDDDKVFEEHLA